MMTSPDPEVVQALLAELEAKGLTLEDLAGRVASPSVSELMAGPRAKLTGRTRNTYDTHLRRFEDGYGPVCDQTCEPCLLPAGAMPFTCGCDCRKCRDSRVTLEAQGPRPYVQALTKANAETLATIALRVAVKHGLVDNRVRADKGKAPKVVTGVGARETAIAAARWLYRLPETGTFSGALAIKKGSRPEGHRRALADFELLEIVDVTANGGDDPELDLLLLDLAVECGTRREGAYLLTMGALRPDQQLIRVTEKYKRPQDTPASRALIDRILAHAVERGGPQCDPDSVQYRPDAPALWYRPSRRGPRPLTDRRFDTLAGRWQRAHTWMGEEGVTYHWVRHSLSSVLKSRFGPQYAKRFLRHTPGDVTDEYGSCTLPELAGAMSQLLAYEHPLVTGRADRRSEVLRRFGLDDVTT